MSLVLVVAAVLECTLYLALMQVIRVQDRVTGHNGRNVIKKTVTALSALLSIMLDDVSLPP